MTPLTIRLVILVILPTPYCPYKETNLELLPGVPTRTFHRRRISGLMAAMNDTPSTFEPRHLWHILQKQQPVGRWLVGFSGGLDSSVLLDALVASKPKQPIVVIHVNHALSGNADHWQAHCEAQCREWGLELKVEQVSVHASGFGLEDAAREARYAAFARNMRQGDCLLLGHHLDDQAETVLLRMMRGAGPRGLSGIVASRPFAAGTLVRPLLKFERRALERYAHARQLSWITDESNQDARFDRNFLRQAVFPLLAERWPNFAGRWQRAAEACRAADQLSRDLAELDLARLDERSVRAGWSIDHARLAKLAGYRRDNLLRCWAGARGFPVMERRHLTEIERQFFSGKAVSGAMVRWAGTALGFYRGRLHLIEAPFTELVTNEPVVWDFAAELILPDGSRLSRRRSAGGLRWSGERVEVRWREGGERCRPDGRAHSQTLKKLLQEYELEPWWRNRMPLVFMGGELAAVGDLWVCSAFAAGESEAGWQLNWTPSGARGTRSSPP